MRKETDLTAIKEVMKTFLHFTIEETELSPLVVEHPIFQYGTMMSAGKTYNLLDHDDSEKVIELYEHMINNASTPKHCITIMRSAYCMTFLKYVKDNLSLVDFSELLAYAWTTEDSVNTDMNVSLAVAARWFRQADKKILMNETEYEIYLSLPDSFTVYRGVSTGRNPDGMSWTQDLEKAEWFSRRYGTGYVLEGLAQKKDVLAFFDRRGEKEIVISAKCIMNKKKMP